MTTEVPVLDSPAQAQAKPAGSQTDPFIGPRPFETADAIRFFGRDGEADVLTSLIIAHPAVLLYAQSGAGKTSLLNARVIPALQQRKIEVMHSVRVGGPVPPGVDNPYRYNTLLHLSGQELPTTASMPSVTSFLGSQPLASLENELGIRVMVFDQFEELFTSAPERWQARHAFIEDLGEALDADPCLRAVFAMREEYIAALDALAMALPERLRTRFHLEQLRRDAAVDAVREPVHRTTSRRFAEGAAERLVDKLLHSTSSSESEQVLEYVEPLHLQLVCKRLWEALPKDTTVISVDVASKFADLPSALRAYYESCVAQVVATGLVSEGTVRTWFERHLITADGSRSIVERGETATGNLTNDIVAQLQKVYLVRSEMRGTKEWYELAHDQLIVPIQQSNAAWMKSGSQEARRLDAVRSLKARAEAWEVDSRNPLLTGDDLADAVKLCDFAEELQLDPAGSIRQFVTASETRHRRVRERQRIILAGVAVALVLAVPLAVMGVQQRVQQHLNEIQDTNARTTYAEAADNLLHRSGNEFEALSLALRAVAPSTPGEPPREDFTPQLKRARAAIEGPRLRRASSRMAEIQLSPDVAHVLAVGPREVCHWNVQEPGKEHCVALSRTADSREVRLVPPFWALEQALRVEGAGPEMHLWDVAARQERFPEVTRRATAVSINGVGGTALVIGRNGALVLGLPQGAAENRRTVIPELREGFGEISPDNRFVVTAGLTDSRMRLWDAESGKFVDTLDAMELPGLWTVMAIRFSADSRHVAVLRMSLARQGVRVDVWSIEPGQKPRNHPFIRIPASFADVRFSGERVVTWADGTLDVWSLDGIRVQEPKRFDAAVEARLLPSGKVFVRITEDNQSRFSIWDAEHQVGKDVTGISADVVFAAPSPDLRTIAIVNDGYQPVIVNTDEPKVDWAKVPAGDLIARTCAYLKPYEEYAKLVESKVCR